MKATTTDIYAKLAKGECANFRNNACQGQAACAVINGEPCQYFADYVKPLLQYPEFSSRYGREAKVAVALNPKAKIVRKRRLAQEPALTMEAVQKTPSTQPKAVSTPPPAPPTVAPKAPKAAKKLGVAANTARAPKRNAPPARPAKVEVPVTTVVSVSGTVRTKPAHTPAAVIRPPARATAQQGELILELSPATSPKRGTTRRR